MQKNEILKGFVPDYLEKGFGKAVGEIKHELEANNNAMNEKEAESVACLEGTKKLLETESEQRNR